MRKGCLKALIVFFALVSHQVVAVGQVQAGAGPGEWERTLAAARKEGRINLYVGRYGTEPLLEEFRREYPDIRLTTVNGTGSQLATRILAEQRAGKVFADLFSGGANSNYNLLYKGRALDSIKATLLLPEVVEPSNWYEGEQRYADPEGEYIFIYIANPSASSLFYNTQLVNPSEFKSYWDLLHPKWKGKIVSQDPTGTGMGGTMIFFYNHPELGTEFLRRLFGTMEMTFSRDRRQISDWLAQGKFPLCFGCRDVQRAKVQGLPVDELQTPDWKEGVSLSTGGGSISFIKGAPHANAAKVFINWFLSRRGQMAVQKYRDLYGDLPPNSRRIDIPKDDLPPESKLIPGRRYLDVSRAEWQDLTPLSKLIKESMKSK